MTYYFYTTGRMADDVIVTISGKKYYFDENGKLYKGGWLDYKDGHTYYFYRGDGHMLKSCWITSTIDGKKCKFYVRANGYRAEGWLKNSSGDYRYFLYRDGRMLTGWNQISGKKYYFDPDTASGMKDCAPSTERNTISIPFTATCRPDGSRPSTATIITSAMTV